jgi:hypothetical protein
MKKIWIVGIAKAFDLCSPKLQKLHTKYQPLSSLPIKQIPETGRDFSLELYEYMSDEFITEHQNQHFTSFHLDYTDNPEKIRKEWYSGVIFHYKHLKSLEKGQLLKLDKRTTRPMKRIIEEANNHREDFPELWL